MYSATAILLVSYSYTTVRVWYRSYYGGVYSTEWNGTEWNGTEWNGMERNGMEWNGMMD